MTTVLEMKALIGKRIEIPVHYDLCGRAMRRWNKPMTTVLEMKALIGKRIEIPVHYDLWARGARYGEVTSFRHGKPGHSSHLLVKMDHPQIRRRVKIWSIDIPYIKVI
jgi:hypothetical protein